MSNQIKTILLMGLLSIVLIFFGRMLGGSSGMGIALVMSLVMNVGGYLFSDKIALAMSGAKPASEQEYQELHAMVFRLSKKMNIPKPKLYVTPDEQANAFATGRGPGNASVAVTQGIMRVLKEDELEGVIAHELAHIKNYDILIATIASILAGMISYLANMSLFSGGGDEEDRNPLTGIIGFLVLPLAATLIQLAISRQREFSADERAAQVLGNGRPLARALRSIERSVTMNPMTQNPGMASLYIANPMGTWNSKVASLFATHPPTEERIKRLEALR
jgi:heat shock protein HtpX